MFNFKDTKRSNSASDIYNTAEVLALAFAAHRTNKGYIKNSEIQYPNTDCAETIVKRYANKEIVKFQITGKFIPQGYIHVPIKDCDRENAEKAVAHFQKYAFGILGGTLNDFQKNILDIIFNEKVGKYDLGLLAYVPEMIARDAKQDTLEDTLETVYANSQHIGNVKDKWAGKITILNSFFSNNYQCWIYSAGTDGNLVSFFNKKELEVGKTYDVTARIKFHGQNRIKNHFKETTINYVKFV